MEAEEEGIKTFKQHLKDINKKKQMWIGTILLSVGLVVPWQPLNWLLFITGLFMVLFFYALYRVDEKNGK